MDQPPNIQILFMDDEIHAQIPVVSGAIERLRQEGYEVVPCETMGETRRQFYETPLKAIAVLDIDMASSEGRGSGVADLFRTLDNQCKVIMFSARGDVEDWFEVTNRHVFGYVDKNGVDPVGKLVRLVGRAVEELDAGLVMPQPRPAGTVLLASDLQAEGFSLEQQEEAVRNAGLTPRRELLESIPALMGHDDCAAVLLVARHFSTRPNAFKSIREICYRQPWPNVVICTEGKRENRGFILDCIDAQPFRLLDMLKQNFPDNIVDALNAAASWCGGNEVFNANEDDMQKITSGWTSIDLPWEMEEIESLHSDIESEDPKDGQ